MYNHLYQKEKTTQEYRRAHYPPATHFLGVLLNSLAQHRKGVSWTRSTMPYPSLPPPPPPQPHLRPLQLWSNPSLPQSSQTEKESLTKVEHTEFLSEFLPGFWEHKPIQIFVATLTYAAMQQGEDNKTRALLSLAFRSPPWGRRRKPGQESKRVADGRQLWEERGARGQYPGGVSWKSAPHEVGEQQQPFRCVGSKVCSRVRSDKINRGVPTSQRAKVTSVSGGGACQMQVPPSCWGKNGLSRTANSYFWLPPA